MPSAQLARETFKPAVIEAGGLSDRHLHLELDSIPPVPLRGQQFSVIRVFMLKFYSALLIATWIIRIYSGSCFTGRNVTYTKATDNVILRIRNSCSFLKGIITKTMEMLRGRHSKSETSNLQCKASASVSHHCHSVSDSW